MTSSSDSKRYSPDDISDLYYRLRSDILRVPYNPFIARHGASRNARHFERCAELLNLHGLEATGFLRAQIACLRDKAYPTTLYSAKALIRYEDFVANEKACHQDPAKREARLDKMTQPPEDLVDKAVRDFNASKARVTRLMKTSPFDDRMLVALNNVHVLSPAYLIFIQTVSEGWESGTLGPDLAKRISHYFAPMTPEQIARFRYIVSRKPE